MDNDPVKNAKEILNVQQGFQELAKLSFDIFRSFMIAGFNESQALYMTSQWLNNITRVENKK